MPTITNFLFISLLLSTGFLPLQAQNCTQAEVSYLAENADLLAQVSQDCAFECILPFNQNACLLSCVAEQIDVSEACLACSVAQINCVLDECAFACINANSPACQNCINSNCLPPYFVCIGDDDVDGFTEEGGDCNNSDPTIFPGAEDLTIDGIDQNCDNVDGPVNVAELEVNPSFAISPIRQGMPFTLIAQTAVNLSFFDTAGRNLSFLSLAPGEYVETPPLGALLLRITSETRSEVFKIQH